MGESTCVMQPFPYVPSGISNEAQECVLKQGNPLNALTQSVSFGRFVSESLSWEKWSTFSHKKYVEEAERYSRPGSVAEKKAFFEAHYKKIAERKAAALVEQENAASNNANESRHGTNGNDTKTRDLETVSLNSKVGDDKKQEVEALYIEEGGVVSESNKVEGSESVVQHKVSEVERAEVDISKERANGNSVVNVKETELNLTAQEKPLSEHSNVYQEDRVSMGKKKSALSFSNLPFSPARPTARVHSNKENNATPINKPQPVMNSMNKTKATPKSTRKSIYSTPSREINRLASIFRKIDGAKVGSTSKAPKNCSTPLKAPNLESKNRTLRQALSTPLSENKRGEPSTPESSTVGTKTARAKWSFLPADFSKLLSPCRNKSSQSPKWSTPFRFRTEERAARRKKKLEEKFNANEDQKVQQQTTLKEKAETELRKLGQSFCFKARPLPDFYKERANQAKKVPQTQPPSATPARNSTPSKAWGKATSRSRDHVKTRKEYP